MALPTAAAVELGRGAHFVSRRDRAPALDEIDVHGLEVVVDREGHGLAREVPQPDELVSGDVSDIEVFEHVTGEVQ